MSDNRRITDIDIDLGAIIQWVFENGVFVVGAIILYSRTADLLSVFAPKTFLGYVGIEDLYGMISALLVEGTFFVGKMQIGRARNALAWAWNVLLIAVPFLISLLAQPVDSFVVREAVGTLPQSQQVMIYWLVPMIPGIIVALFLGNAVFNSAPADLFKGFTRRENKFSKNEPKAEKPRMKADDFLDKLGMSRGEVEKVFAGTKDHDEGYQALLEHGIDKVSVSKPDFNNIYYQIKPKANPTPGGNHRK